MLWQVQEAKANLSKLIELAATAGAQIITYHGRERVVVISKEEYQSLLDNKPSFKAHLLGGPKVKDFAVKRSKDKGRSIEL